MTKFLAQYSTNIFFQFFYYSFFMLLGAYLLSKILPYITLKVLKVFVNKTKNTLDDKILEAVHPFLKRLIILGGFYLIALNFRNYFSLFDAYFFQKNILDFKYYKNIIQFFDVFFFLYLTLLTFLFAIKFSDVFFEWYETRISGDEIDNLRKSSFLLVKKISRIVIIIIFATFILEYFGLDIKALLVSFGVGSLAIAFAAQETLSNMISGFIIMIDRPFTIGDAIKLPTGEIGIVQDIGFRSSKILDQEKNILILSNSELLRSRVINFNCPEKKYIFFIEASVKFYEFKETLETCSNIIAKSENQKIFFEYLHSELISASPDNYIFRFYFSTEFSKDIRQSKSYIFEKFVKELRNLTTEVAFKQNVINLKLS